MPSFTYTPGALELAGGEINPEPIRFSFTAARLVLSGATINAGPTLSTGLQSVLNAILDTLFSGEAIVDQQGRPTRRFAQIWQNAMQAIKDALTTQGGEIDELQAIYAAINQAQSTASQAVQTAQNTASEQALAQSYTDPVGVLSAASDGTITILAHDRVYFGTGARASINAGSVSGFAPGSYVTVFYSDPSRAGGAVAFEGTTDAVAQTGNVHVVGQVQIPQVGQPDAQGAGPVAPGYALPDNIADAYAAGYR